MSPTSTALTTKVENGSPYQLDPQQTLKASKALIKHMKSAKTNQSNTKQSLLADAEEEEEASSAAIYLTVTTKKHITDQKRLKPSKITVPHPLNTSNASTICLITCEPQRTYKDIVASPAFPSELASRITRVIDIKKLKTKYKQYEAQRQLRDNHSIFLADDRIITRLPQILGKTFYKSTVSRPIPIDLQAPAPKTDGKRVTRAKDGPKTGTPKQIAHEVEKTVKATLVHLSPSTSTSVRVGYASWTPEQLAENIEAVVNTMVEKFVPKKWRGVKSLHIKGPETMALPIWLADELWVDDADVLDEDTAKKAVEANISKKRKSILGGEEAGDGKKRKSNGEDGSKTAKKQKLPESNDDKLDKEIALRKEMLKKQKADAAKSVENDIPKATKKSKKSKAAGLEN